MNKIVYFTMIGKGKGPVYRQGIPEGMAGTVELHDIGGSGNGTGILKISGKDPLAQGIISHTAGFGIITRFKSLFIGHQGTLGLKALHSKDKE